MHYRINISMSLKNFLPCIILSLVVVFLNCSIINAQENDCKTNLQEAEEFYTQGKWTEAIDKIQQCLKNDNVSETEQGEAYRLLGLVYVATELEKDANKAFKNLLIMVPNYKVDPEKDPPQLQKIVEEIAISLNPIITGITPDNANEGDKGFMMTVNGTNFVYGSVVRFNGGDKKTIFVDSTKLTATITADDLVDDGEYDVIVYSPISEGKLSNTEEFKVNSTGSFPWTWVAVGAGAVAAGVVAILTLGLFCETFDQRSPACF